MGSSLLRVGSGWNLPYIYLITAASRFLFEHFIQNVSMKLNSHIYGFEFQFITNTYNETQFRLDHHSKASRLAKKWGCFWGATNKS